MNFADKFRYVKKNAYICRLKMRNHKIKQSIKDNHRTLQLNKSYGNMTDDDLKFGLELFQTPAWKNQIKAMKEVMNHPGEFSMVFTRKYLNWLKKQGIEMEHMSPLLSE